MINTKLDTQYFQIRDKYRKNILPYCNKVYSVIPEIENTKILDVGCGSGVPSIFLAENFNCNVVAVDNDSRSINELNRKVKELGLENGITIVNRSIFDVDLEESSFDIILAEGFLNVVGFESGFKKLIKLLKLNGHFIIHDEFPNQKKKIKIIEKNNCILLKTLNLDEYVWWNEYYKQLEIAISDLKDKELLKLFKSDLQEIELYKQDSSFFKSTYYIIEKN